MTLNAQSYAFLGGVIACRFHGFRGPLHSLRVGGSRRELASEHAEVRRAQQLCGIHPFFDVGDFLRPPAGIGLAHFRPDGRARKGQGVLERKVTQADADKRGPWISASRW